MKPSIVLCLLFAGLALRAGDNRLPVVVELFTSEGCSSCPPADALLAKLDRSGEISRAQVIALEEHVDYWNQLGWLDPFSSPQFRARQNDYAIQFKTDNVYTPQMVVNGRVAFVGNDSSRAYDEIGRAAAASGATPVELVTSRNAKDPALVDLLVELSFRSAKQTRSDVYLAITESNLRSRVSAGENAGRELRHAPVVRSFGVIGRINGAPHDLTQTLKLPKEWKRDNLRAVVFVQDQRTRFITGAASTDLREK